MRVRFWGVRGSVPWATSTSIGHGCNTPCVELTDDASGAVLVLDTGPGIVGRGEALDSEPRPVPILLTHNHCDHLQGLPFFSARYRSRERRALRPVAVAPAGHLWLFHHKPGRTDAELKAIEAEARLLFAATDAASEGDSFIV